MVIAGGGGGANTHYLCQLSGRWPSTKEAYYTGLGQCAVLYWPVQCAVLDGGLVQKRPIILACPVCGLYNGFYGVGRYARWAPLARLLRCLAVQRCCFVCCDTARCKFCTGLCLWNTGFYGVGRTAHHFGEPNLVPHWYTNEYKNTLIASMLFFILYWQINFLDGRASTESLASML